MHRSFSSPAASATTVHLYTLDSECARKYASAWIIVDRGTRTPYLLDSATITRKSIHASFRANWPPPVYLKPNLSAPIPKPSSPLLPLHPQNAAVSLVPVPTSHATHEVRIYSVSTPMESGTPSRIRLRNSLDLLDWLAPGTLARRSSLRV